MNWQAIGAMGEILGAAAVVLTLFYLGVQIRQNTKVSRAQISKDMFLATRFNGHVIPVRQKGPVRLLIPSEEAERLAERRITGNWVWNLANILIEQ